MDYDRKYESSSGYTALSSLTTTSKYEASEHAIPKFGKRGVGADGASPPGMCDHAPSLGQLYGSTLSMRIKRVSGWATSLRFCRIRTEDASFQLCKMKRSTKAAAFFTG